MIDFDGIFEEMKPYDDLQFQAAMKRVIEHDDFNAILRYAFSEELIPEVRDRLNNMKSVQEFQEQFVKELVEIAVDLTSDDLTVSGVENLDKNQSYLFISNHRDIVLDSAILQTILIRNQHHSSQITFGSNLMSSQFIIDLGKSNKMFTLFRGGSRADIYRNALVHSRYIRDVILKNNDSVWIAQRDGRTKDGDDKTQLSLLKMLTIKQEDPIQTLEALNIVPISISYEYEPCDMRKVAEGMRRSENGNYKKSKGEDLHSIIQGIREPKGRIHLAIGKSISSSIRENRVALDKDNIHEFVQYEMDKQIYQNYKLHPINYVAFDSMHANSKYLGTMYTREDIVKYDFFWNEKVAQFTDLDSCLAKELLIKLYAMPVVNLLKQSKKNRHVPEELLAF